MIPPEAHALNYTLAQVDHNSLTILEMIYYTQNSKVLVHLVMCDSNVEQGMVVWRLLPHNALHLNSCLRHGCDQTGH